MEEMRLAMEPGITENALWARLHHGCIANGAEWFETRLLSSGPAHQPMVAGSAPCASSSAATW